MTKAEVFVKSIEKVKDDLIKITEYIMDESKKL